MSTTLTTRLNAIFRLGNHADGIAAEVTVDDDGHIRLGELLGDQQLTQLEAVQVAEKLLTAVQASIHRAQALENPNFFDTREILRRQESRLGVAIHACTKIF